MRRLLADRLVFATGVIVILMSVSVRAFARGCVMSSPNVGLFDILIHRGPSIIFQESVEI